MRRASIMTGSYVNSKCKDKNNESLWQKIKSIDINGYFIYKNNLD